MSQQLTSKPTNPTALAVDDPDAFPYAGKRTGTDSRPAIATPTVCPECSSRAVSVQGLSDCPNCTWTSQ